MEYREYILEYLEKGKDAPLFRLEDIPNIDLYVDQILNLLDEPADIFFQNEHEKPLTKTMINNYTKDKVIPPPQNKKYNKNHIILLLLTIYLKPILSIKEIKNIFDALDKNLRTSEKLDLSAFYKNTIDIIEQNKAVYLESCENSLNNIIDKLDPLEGKENLELISLILLLAIQANTNISLCKTLIEKYFAEEVQKKKD